jgi:hypothetical protein
MRAKSKYGLAASDVCGLLTLYCDDSFVRAKYFTDRLQRQDIMVEWKRQIKNGKYGAEYYITIQLEKTDDAD